MACMVEDSFILPDIRPFYRIKTPKKSSQLENIQNRNPKKISRTTKMKSYDRNLAMDNMKPVPSLNIHNSVVTH